MGTVKNQSGAGIPGAQMLFEGPQTHTRNRNSNGGYQTLDLIPGTYKITVTAFGYKPKIEEGVELPATTVVKNYILEPQ
ncbi:hypothetical protein KSU1_B0381 [Candidatus Jettenia caeni]|uniref:TonB-dependent receptor n=1 Tax=Candidatus Jettenia caeni TaxID=247490 RepID=I3IHP3_9BACT|nr:carboxypeptidase-like regulatory domain-containing protein [Candidatus Jettenia sp. AMX1]NUN23165.1 carboxypeptidase regulatory-like domain-containing protein [Candidatus Jettenia caeni]WKZ16565.1 MAG: carboxypeptidase-like regulatory domain-containing protein [Candidatus Jettenia caeni]GAB61238.1 hypothetical protein KSU1_B0381 [Candidatus Jettenia caeni]